MIKNILKIATLSLVSVLLCACSDDENEVKKLITFHVGTEKANAMASNRTLEIMPVSGLSIMTDTDHFMYNADLKQVHLADSQPLPDGSRIRGFYFICNPRGAKRLFQASASNMGGYIVAKYDGAVIGLRQVDATMADGAIFIIPELSSKQDLPKLIEEMNKAITTVNEIKEKADAW